MARLDRSGIGKELAQIAAVVGRSVQRSVLTSVCRVSTRRLKEPLSTLVRLGVLEWHSGEDVYTFSHALLRDAAYDTLLRERRRDLHLRVARALEMLDPAGMSRHPELLALHLTEGGLAEEAAAHWIEAARRSLGRSALTEATRMLRRGLLALEQSSETDTNLDLRLQTIALLGPALNTLKGPRSIETRDLYVTAEELARRVPEGPSHFPIYWLGWSRLSIDGAQAQQERAAFLLEHAIRRNDPDLILEAHHCCWASNLNSGVFDRCCLHVEAGLSIYDQHDHAHLAPLFGNHDAKVCAHGMRLQIYWMQGKLRTAAQEEAQAVSWAARISHQSSRAHAMELTLLHRACRRDYKEVFERAGQLISLAAEHGFVQRGPTGLIFRGWALATESDPVAGLKMLEEGLARYLEVASSEDVPVYLCLLAEVLMAAGKPERAVERILAKLPELERTGFRYWMPELLRVLGDAILAADPASTHQGRKRYIEAAELAESQGASMLNLRIATSEARLDIRLGASDRASRRVQQALSAIPEDDGSRDLVEARQLIITSL